MVKVYSASLIRKILFVLLFTFTVNQGYSQILISLLLGWSGWPESGVVVDLDARLVFPQYERALTWRGGPSSHCIDAAEAHCWARFTPHAPRGAYSHFSLIVFAYGLPHSTSPLANWGNGIGPCHRGTNVLWGGPCPQFTMASANLHCVNPAERFSM